MKTETDNFIECAILTGNDENLKVSASARKIIGFLAMFLGSLCAIVSCKLSLYHPWTTMAFLGLAGAGYDLTFGWKD